MEVTTLKRLLFIWILLMLLPLGAQAVTVPAGVTEIQDEAFANTDIDALMIPASVKKVGAGVLRGGSAAYILAESAGTVFAADAAEGVRYVFAPAGSNAAVFPGYRALENLRRADGLYYFLQDTAEPLCAVNPGSLSGTVTVPKVLDGVPVTSLAGLYLQDAASFELRVPQYLAIPDGLTATPYAAMTLTPPVPEMAEAEVGQEVTWTTSVEGAYGDVSYQWSFTIGGETIACTTSEPAVTYAHPDIGRLRVSVTATDALGDTAAASAEQSLLVTSPQTMYRALLIGNTYPGSVNSLPGPDNDLSAMKTMLGSMTGTPFSVRSSMNLTASGMQAAIASTFDDADATDVSLLYYSGHGESNGSLIGTGNSYLSVYGLRTALQKIPGVKIVILDCCYSGNVIGRSAGTEETASPSAFNRAVINAFASVSRSAENLADGGYVVLTACRKDQLSNTMIDPVSGVAFGAFTYGLCYGSGYDEWQREVLPNMPADADGNRAITLREAAAGARERVAFLKRVVSTLDQDLQTYGDSAFVLWAK